ncbi:hypothetical protein AXY43_23150 [Clostridium sp. MF28]|uniref:hypothetical protein n=1 Tax=Clostridium TaxID=1485 RepID=UPI000CF9C4A9|nr:MULTISPECIES: hypothetical protein [Clostridium]AVK50679.1 hypothetical protein AXY43_23150 [Clostridium sp. MF28]PSM58992.1 hypothetical protein C4L39_03800 [Clostridium diolis]
MALSKNVDVNIYYNSYDDNINVLTKIDSSVISVITKIVTVNSAYIKILNQNGDKNNLVLNVGIYDKKDGTLLKQECYSFIPDVSSTSKNFIQQGYEYLKTLEEYKDVVDLLDEGQTV